MQFSGYEHKFRSEVICSALAAYDKLRKLETDGVRPLYRPREWNREERDKERISKKTDWYKRGGDDSVIFVPATPGSNLRKKMEEKIRKSSFKIRVVEKAGVSLKRKLQRSNPFKKKTCDRQNCLVCTTGGKGPCDAVGINYELVCEDCQNDGEVSKYVGGKHHTAPSQEEKNTKATLPACGTPQRWRSIREISTVAFKHASEWTWSGFMDRTQCCAKLLRRCGLATHKTDNSSTAEKNGTISSCRTSH